ncbi:MAG TPA: nuclear transport factor 2 family protein [Terriglobales bacterium]|nr:nuclear transport factor 2 family protein [Terriglobales bacterium]
MKFCVLLLAWVLMTIAALAQPKAVPPPPAITYDQAVANEKKLFAADQKHDMDTIKSLIDDDFVDINKDGSLENKAALLKEIPTLKLLHYAQKNFRVVTMGPYAYSISYDSAATVVGADGKQSQVQSLLNTVWIWRDGRWQILLHYRGEQKPLSAR